MPNVLISSEIGSERRTVLEHSQLIECTDIRLLSLAHGSKLRGSNVYLRIVKKINCKFVFKFSQGTCPWRAFAWIFFSGFKKKILLGGSVVQTIYKEYIVFRGSNISCSLATSKAGLFGQTYRMHACFLVLRSEHQPANTEHSVEKTPPTPTAYVTLSTPSGE